MFSPPPTSYDQVPYRSLPFQQTHPSHLAAIARLLGMAPPDPRRARVLELGCAGGGNLIPMAVSMPGAEFVGIDLSEVHIREGMEVVEALKLGNVRLRHGDIAAVDGSWGKFDYILCHGVYSWVPEAVRESILGICSELLTSNGIAYISYNTLPGWRMRGTIRDLMRFHAERFEGHELRVEQARAVLEFLSGAVPEDAGEYGMMLRSEMEMIRRLPDYYILHEYLEDVNEPVYFHQFVADACRHGLQYLAETNFSSMLASGFAPEVAETLRRTAPDLVRQEQLMDFLRNRTFRQTLLVRQAVELDRAVTSDRLESLWIASPAEPASAEPDLREDVLEEFKMPSGASIGSPVAGTKAALLALGAQWPRAMAWGELMEAAGQMLGGSEFVDAEVVRKDLLQCYAAGLLELHGASSAFVSVPGDRPIASPLARWQVSRGNEVSNLRNEHFALGEAECRLLALLDGSRDRADLEREMPGDPVGAMLDAMGKGALLVA